MPATGLKTEKEIKQSIAYTPEEQESYRFYLSQCEKARDQKFDANRLLNYMNVLTDDQANRDLRNSYLKPKLNDHEVRVNTGTVEKKILTVVNEILSFNFTPEIVAFDQEDREIEELGSAFQDIVKRTNEQEQDEDMFFPALWDLATRRKMYMEEYWEEKIVVDKRKKQYDLEQGIIKFDTKEFRVQRPRKRLLDLRTIFEGDISIPPHRFNDQPFIVKYDNKSYREAKTIYGGFKNWKFVQPGGTSNGQWFEGEFDWRFDQGIQDDRVEILHYYSYPDDEYQLILNGVMMLKPGTPLPWEYEGYSIRGFVYREMEQNFAYGQLFSVNAKTWASVKDEFLRLAIRKFRQAVEPPKGVRGNKVLSRDIFNAGAMVNNISSDEVFSLIDHDGLSGGEQAVMELVMQQVEEEVGVSKLFQGVTEKGLTATQAMEQMRQAIKSIGLLVFAWRRVMRDMTLLRVYNVVENGTNPLDTKLEEGQAKKVYASYTSQDTELENGLTGTSIVQFVDTPPQETEMAAMLKAEEELAKAGKNVRWKMVDINKLRAIRMNWFVNVLPKEKDSTALNKAMFKEELADTVNVSNVTGRPINPSTVVEKYERVYKNRNMFQEAPPQNMQQEQLGVQQQALAMKSKVQTQMQKAGQPQRPSLNTLVGQAV